MSCRRTPHPPAGVLPAEVHCLRGMPFVIWTNRGRFERWGDGGSMNNFGDKVLFIRSVADLIRDSFKRSKYRDVILPLTVLRRMD
jgi:hypothetical protein